MRKLVFAALVALCLAVPGTVCATPVVSVELLTSTEITPHLVESILRAASEQSEWTFEALFQMHNNGDLTIDKVGTSYRVNLLVDGGAIVLAEESF